MRHKTGDTETDMKLDALIYLLNYISSGEIRKQQDTDSVFRHQKQEFYCNCNWSFWGKKWSIPWLITRLTSEELTGGKEISGWY